MQTDQAGVNLGKEILAEEEKQAERKNAKSEKADGEDVAIGDRSFEDGFVAAAEILELPFEAALEAAEERLPCFRPMLVAAHDVHHQRGN
jgi:hypothetical protein